MNLKKLIMEINQNGNNEGSIKTSDEFQDNIKVYPKSPIIKINNSDLKLELKDFKKAVKNEPNIGWFLTIFALWTVIFTSEFNDILSIKGHDLFITFIVITSILTIFLLTPIYVYCKRGLIRLTRLYKRFPSLKKWLHEYESDPKKKADSIINISE